LFVMIFAILFVWSPKSWSRYGWWNHLFDSLFQASTIIFEWVIAHSFSSFLFLHGKIIFWFL
jgi:hypothetical protein